MKNSTIKWKSIILNFAILLCLSCGTPESNIEFTMKVPADMQRTWIGPEYWANPLQDWQLNQGRAECVVSGGDRNLFLLTHELSADPGAVTMSVTLGSLEPDSAKLTDGWVGFKIGLRGEFNDYRDNAVRGIGFPAGLTTNGQLFIGKLDRSSNMIASPLQNIRLVLKAVPVENNYHLSLFAYDQNKKLLARTERQNIGSDWLAGGIALVCSNGKITEIPEARPAIDDGNWGFRSGTARGGKVRFWFSDWQVAGSKVRYHPDRVYGPVLFAQYTLSNHILKLTAQMSPVGDKDGKTVELQIQNDKTNWQTIGESTIDNMARTATFRIENWDNSKDTPYRIVYGLYAGNGKMEEHYFSGVIRKEPWHKEEIAIAAFTGNNDLGFPNNDIIQQLKHHDPDLLFFSGDQIYEGVGGFGAQRSPVEKACLDYLRKWYIFGWTYRDLMRDRPSLCIPDDHDVYHGNLWGAGGKAAPKGLTGYAAQDAGGYKMPPEWVNMVQQTQTSHLPDPYDPAPVGQGIGVYYCSLNYAGISFAILEDRKFKSAPKGLLPEADVQNGWARNRAFDAKKQADVPSAVLLGKRQLKFLKDWAADWRGNTWMKVVLSQTIFANVATLPKEAAYSDEIVPRLRILRENEYPPDDIPVADMDSNGWPQTGRDNALREMRRAFAFHIAGDQHLGSTVQYGIDEWHDASFAFCVPAVSNVWPRRWYPRVPGKNRKPDAPPYAGDFEDGFGNKITVHAVSNPVFTGLKPSRLYDRATGYGIVRFNRNTRNITIECWRRLPDPTETENGQYPGWHITINQLDNYIAAAKLCLPKIQVQGTTDPVVQVIDETNHEVVYTIRINGTEFQPRVFQQGSYTVRVGEPGVEMKEFSGLKAESSENERGMLIFQYIGVSNAN